MRVFAIAFAIVTLLPLMGSEQTPAAAQGSAPLIRSNVVMIVQGENDVTPGDEGKNDFYALKIISYELPYDSARVYTSMPEGARDFNVWTLASPLNESLYGQETTGNMSDSLFIDVPSSHLRNSKFTNTTANESAFAAQDSVFQQVSYSSGALQLSPGFESGSYVSANMSISGAFNILSGNLTFSGSYLDNLTSYLSNDGGITWSPGSNATELNFTVSGTVLRVKFDLEGNSTLGFLPSITSFSLTAEYVQLKTVFTVHVSCFWRQNFTDRRATIDLSEVMSYASPGSFLVMLYTLKGYSPEGVGFSLTKDEGGTMNTYPDKDLYLFSSSAVPSGGNISFALTAPKPDYSWAYYAAGGAVLVGLLGFALLRRSHRSSRPGSAETTEKVSPEETGEARDTRRKELVERKKKVLAELEQAREKGASAESERLKTELKQIRNELNKLPKAMEASAGPSDVAGVSVPSQGEYEPALASIARLDDDFDKGRLPESSYKSLRKQYVSKAAALIATKEAARKEAPDPLVSEKYKLMEAIVALDDEHDRGEIDDKVYGELRASYRKELAELTGTLDGKKEGE